MAIYVLYHANCLDGYGAMMAAYCRFRDSATYIPVQYGSPLPDLDLSGELNAVYILDFSYKRDILEDLTTRVEYLLILDHHKTAEQDLRGLPYAVFDMNRSGAVMAWEYFHPTTKVPDLISYIQDRDLWRFQLPGSKEVNAGLGLYKNQRGKWEHFLNNDSSIQDLKTIGDTVTLYQNEQVNSLVAKNLRRISFMGHNVIIYNTTQLISEMGHEVLTANPDVDFTMSFFVLDYGSVVFNLRSRENMDVSEIARGITYKNKVGGGHKNAAGFTQSLAFLANLLET